MKRYKVFHFKPYLSKYILDCELQDIIPNMYISDFVEPHIMPLKLNFASFLRLSPGLRSLDLEKLVSFASEIIFVILMQDNNLLYSLLSLFEYSNIISYKILTVIISLTLCWRYIM